MIRTSETLSPDYDESCWRVTIQKGLVQLECFPCGGDLVGSSAQSAQMLIANACPLRARDASPKLVLLGITIVHWLLPLLDQIFPSGIVISLVLSVYDYSLANIQRI